MSVHTAQSTATNPSKVQTDERTKRQPTSANSTQQRRAAATPIPNQQRNEDHGNQCVDNTSSSLHDLSAHSACSYYCTAADDVGCGCRTQKVFCCNRSSLALSLSSLSHLSRRMYSYNESVSEIMAPGSPWPKLLALALLAVSGASGDDAGGESELICFLSTCR